MWFNCLKRGRPFTGTDQLILVVDHLLNDRSINRRQTDHAADWSATVVATISAIDPAEHENYDGSISEFLHAADPEAILIDNPDWSKSSLSFLSPTLAPIAAAAVISVAWSNASVPLLMLLLLLLLLIIPLFCCCGCWCRWSGIMTNWSMLLIGQWTLLISSFLSVPAKRKE